MINKEQQLNMDLCEGDRLRRHSSILLSDAAFDFLQNLCWEEDTATSSAEDGLFDNFLNNKSLDLSKTLGDLTEIMAEDWVDTPAQSRDSISAAIKKQDLLQAVSAPYLADDEILSSSVTTTTSAGAFNATTTSSTLSEHHQQEEDPPSQRRASRRKRSRTTHHDDDASDVVPEAVSSSATTKSSKKKKTNKSSNPKAKAVKEEAPKNYVTEINDNDVVSQRGAFGNKHPGSKKYREIIMMNITEYKASSKENKTRISQKIIDYIHEVQKGRFLEFDAVAQMWYEVDNVRARTKTSQCLRDPKTPEARAKKRAKYGC